ncbi:uncharacterized protein F4822DRAFT_97282 [Hypoxylon trugodes]|uniref:uncharacterized protein n=1 Tax=Hypoxylon trugodes TaxID=326681 RepID=UPI00219F50F6|nr:uncharacterized protein F4822DRAFT_97282 [Hypoxylon trugodes]KAI1382800.1 hypothetical protein F4822DRAFT_97282 [Hypoxylon trugodes]
MASTSDFPILDFSNFTADFDLFSRELYLASNKWGFFVLTGTGIRGVDEMFDLSRQFFDLPLEQKGEKIMNEQAIGYDGKTKTTFAASEGMAFSLPSGGIMETDHLPAWWDQSKRRKIEDFKSQCQDLNHALLSCFAVQLGLDKDYFLAMHAEKAPGNTLKLIKYPRMEHRPGVEIPRLSEHTDWGSITLVFTKQGGLEIRDPNNEWCQVPIVPDGIVVNIADALSLWTGKELKSTMHRITWENLPIEQERYSMAYFVNPNLDAPLSNPKDSESQKNGNGLTFGDYYQIRLRLTYGSLEDSDFKDVDPEALYMVKTLGVADAGYLKTNAIAA